MESPGAEGRGLQRPFWNHPVLLRVTRVTVFTLSLQTASITQVQADTSPTFLLLVSTWSHGESCGHTAFP